LGTGRTLASCRPNPPGRRSLVEIAVNERRKTRKGLEVGICGEHGGDPNSIHLCHKFGLNYVSCSPFWVPVARLAAAQAAIGEGAGTN
jgi:pyruvate,orthophosphate dikinase